MKKNHYSLAVPLTGVLLLSAGVPAFAQYLDQPTLASTNRLTLSLRYGLNMHAKFMGIGSAGGPGHYSDGYVLTDSTGNYLGYTSYWGYDNPAQYNQAANTFSFHNAVGGGNAASSADQDISEPGVELTYDRQLGVKEDWHRLRYGVEGALNYMKISLNNSSSYHANVATENYTFGGIPGQIPSAGHRGSYNGNGGNPVLVYAGSPGASTSGTLSSSDSFDADLWGGRLGPYAELPFGDKQQFTILLTGGLAVGLINASENWKQTLALDGGGTSTTAGGGNDVGVLWGWYAGATANYQFTDHWGLSASVQFQDLGTYNHSFGGRTAQLDLSQSVFFELGVSYSF